MLSELAVILNNQRPLLSELAVILNNQRPLLSELAVILKNQRPLLSELAIILNNHRPMLSELAVILKNQWRLLSELAVIPKNNSLLLDGYRLRGIILRSGTGSETPSLRFKVSNVIDASKHLGRGYKPRPASSIVTISKHFKILSVLGIGLIEP